MRCAIVQIQKIRKSVPFVGVRFCVLCEDTVRVLNAETHARRFSFTFFWAFFSVWPRSLEKSFTHSTKNKKQKTKKQKNKKKKDGGELMKKSRKKSSAARQKKEGKEEKKKTALKRAL